MRLFRYGFHTLLIGFLALGLTASCSSLEGPRIVLEADNTTISAGGFEFATITATVTVGGSLKRNASVEFTTNNGSFSSSSDLTDTTVATDDNGQAIVQLWSAQSQGQAEVQVSYSDDVTGETANRNITITFGPPQAGNLPVAGRFSIICDYINIGALRVPTPNIAVPCNVTAQTVQGNNVPVSALGLSASQMIAEAGVLETFVDSFTEETLVRYRAQGGNPAPVDVDPVGGEPSQLGPLGETFNPRDGVVSILLVTRGSEDFQDLNGDGVRDDTEPFTDIAEPFLDVDDDGIYTPGVDEFFDSDGDGQWSDVNGQFDADTFIGAQTKIIWTGPPDETPDGARIETTPPSTTMQDGGSLSVQVYMLDKHLNPVAAFVDNFDYLEFVATGSLTLTPDGTLNLTNDVAIMFDAEGRVTGFVPDAGEHTILVQDGDPGFDEGADIPWNISFTYYLTPGPDDQGDWLTQEQGLFSQLLSGTYR